MSIVRAILGTYKWYHPALLPNQAGFRFIGKLLDNTEVWCKVIEVDGNHKVAREDEKPFLFATLKEWRNH